MTHRTKAESSTPKTTKLTRGRETTQSMIDEKMTAKATKAANSQKLSMIRCCGSRIWLLGVERDAERVWVMMLAGV